MNIKFYKCDVCGQLVAVIDNKDICPSCCNQSMREICPKENEKELEEKHVPVYRLSKDKIEVEVGSSTHPSTEAHYIEWIGISTDQGVQRKYLRPGDKPKVTFYLDRNEKVLGVYAYCNIHSLWKKEIDTSFLDKKDNPNKENKDYCRE